ncbi:MAG: JAB domain-containing protein, partial [Bacteroidales bacterium]|nr:JAB domain-containing protein [Bacteroidales bacterium]
AAALLAALELGRRFVLEHSDPGEALTEPEQVYNRMLPRLKGLRHEECWLILLDSKVRELATVQMTVGGQKSTTIDVALIVRKAIERGAPNLILVHNHPHGDPRPSRGDIKETANLRDACTACSLRLLDHIIIADEHFYSFNSEKMY